MKPITLTAKPTNWSAKEDISVRVISDADKQSIKTYTQTIIDRMQTIRSRGIVQIPAVEDDVTRAMDNLIKVWKKYY